MLLEFRAKNYKSFKDELVFSMTPAPKQKGLDYSVLRQKAGSKNYKALCSAVIYGPNASGKTNIIGAMDTFKNIVLRGHIRNGHDREQNSPNMAANNLELIPNNTNQEPLPIEFSIVFVEDGIKIEYAFAADIGGFLKHDYARKIIFEQLKVNEKLIFLRNDTLKFDALRSIRNYLSDGFEKNSVSAVSLAKSNLNGEELFLMNGFKTMFSAKLVSLIAEWLDRKFIVVYSANLVQLIRKPDDPKKASAYTEKRLNEAMKRFGVMSNMLAYISDENEPVMKLYSLLQTPGKKDGVLIPADLFESYGTLRFINLFQVVMRIIQSGGILAADEFDASIHPMAMMSIINIFHNDEININKAQLIFNTHNPIFMNANLFRRDELKFTERDDASGSSAHYSLSDFGTEGAKGVRKNEDYLKNYFVSQYGAIQDIDFSPIFESVPHNRKEVQ
ncbi:MAG: ATP-binding protein [Peptococcaceae bacterium]|jgi:AAA15 family ATPase/GTPase|nr:ATP-binding protein [Peptococcaceae bacterium]